MYFESAGIEVAPWLPPVAAFVVSFFTSMGGVSGAFLLLPFQMSVLGYTSPSVSATNQLFNIVAIPSGVWRYLREGRMVWPLAWMVILGTLPGVLLGAVIRVAYLPDPGRFKVFAALVLLYISSRMLHDLLAKTGASGKQSAEKRFQELAARHRGRQQHGQNLPRVEVEEFSFKKVVYVFYGERYECSGVSIFILSLLVGVVGGIYGIGGGSIIAPFFVSFLGLPVYTVAGAALMGTFVTSIAGVGFYEVLAHFYPEQSVAPDWTLGLLFGAGGMAGMYLGARFQKRVSARLIKAMLVAVMLFTGAKYCLDVFS